MQVKKDSVEKSILRAATDDFAEHGFSGASMRRMAKNAGTGLGNFYNYFSGKDEIFNYIVSDQYNKMQQYIARTLSEKLPVDLCNIRDTRLFCQELRRWLMRTEPFFNKTMLLLLDCSAGTRYGSAKDELVVGLTQVFTSLFALPISKNTIPPALFFEQTLNSLIHTARKLKRDPKLKEILFNSFFSAYSGYILCEINI